ncbi:hypothetical protein DRJ17_02560 [Candidatus Woesearchaeota archaeon]|nr:MAG: hypothetical protein DRJ17_02560 [Candidatus Woesearchaeota archaeon]
MLKADLHIHTSKDPEDRRYIRLSPKEIITIAAKKKFDVISITHHSHVYFNEELKNFAKKQGILLIPGCEHRIDGKDILIYNITEKERRKIKTFKDLNKIRNKALVIAPHPYYFGIHSLGRELCKNINLFDAIEYSHFYTRWFNPNKKAIKIAIKHNKPLIGTSDTHYLFQFGTTYTLIDAKKNIKSVFKAIKENKIVVKSKPLSPHVFLILIARMIFTLPKKLFQIISFKHEF